MRGILRRAGREFLLLTAILLASGAVWAFVELAEAVVEGETHALDTALLLALRDPTDRSDPLGPGWFEEVMRDFSALGGVALLTLMVLAAAGFLQLRGESRRAAMVLAATGSGALLMHLLKWGFARPRPDLVPHESLVYSASFPSGHAMLAALVYLTLGALLAEAQPNARLKLYLLGLALLMTLLVGASRLYLGVHWPTDILAGWAAGAAWALLSLSAARLIGKSRLPFGRASRH